MTQGTHSPLFDYITLRIFCLPSDMSVCQRVLFKSIDVLVKLWLHYNTERVPVTPTAHELVHSFIQLKIFRVSSKEIKSFFPT